MFVPAVVLTAIASLYVWCWCRIASKAGFSKAWGFLVMVPVANLIALWALALVQWPSVGAERAQPSAPR